MGTMTIRRIDDDVLDRFKAIAKHNNRSAEAEARSLLEDFTAAHIVRHDMERSNFFDEVRRFMDEEGIDGFGEDEFILPERNIKDGRPPVEFDAS